MQESSSLLFFLSVSLFLRLDLFLYLVYVRMRSYAYMGNIHDGELTRSSSHREFFTKTSFFFVLYAL